ncbi:MAG TPA: hypothetical protein VMF90_14225 [Rhizobiaceae bacterium]|nr:hypothetical protein [Rhizobiaceae bacterium]
MDKATAAIIKERCGIVMPISAIDGCSADHRSEVKEIFSEAIEEAGFEPMLVSDADESGIIHKRIIQNLYENPIIVCDVSGRNPNVMFELGIRLAFDKPTIIVKDDATPYNFDTSAIEHIEYPRDLRFARIVDFKERLSDKINKTHQAALSDKNFTTFLKHFGEFKVPKLDRKEVSESEYILEELRGLKGLLERGVVTAQIEQTGGGSASRRIRSRVPPRLKPGMLDFCLRNVPDEVVQWAKSAALAFPGVGAVKLDQRSQGHAHLLVSGPETTDLRQLRDTIEERFTSTGA